MVFGDNLFNDVRDISLSGYYKICDRQIRIKEDWLLFLSGYQFRFTALSRLAATRLQVQLRRVKKTDEKILYFQIINLPYKNFFWFYRVFARFVN